MTEIETDGGVLAHWGFVFIYIICHVISESRKTMYDMDWLIRHTQLDLQGFSGPKLIIDCIESIH